MCADVVGSPTAGADRGGGIVSVGHAVLGAGATGDRPYVMSHQSLDYQTPPRAKAMPRVMRGLALVLSAAGLVLLLVVADLRWGFVRLPVGEGPESGLIASGL